jgi:hypothetical protein
MPNARAILEAESPKQYVLRHGIRSSRRNFEEMLGHLGFSNATTNEEKARDVTSWNMLFAVPASHLSIHVAITPDRVAVQVPSWADRDPNKRPFHGTYFTTNYTYMADLVKRLVEEIDFYHRERLHENPIPLGGGQAIESAFGRLDKEAKRCVQLQHDYERP